MCLQQNERYRSVIPWAETAWWGIEPQPTWTPAPRFTVQRKLRWPSPGLGEMLSKFWFMFLLTVIIAMPAHESLSGQQELVF